MPTSTDNSIVYKHEDQITNKSIDAPVQPGASVSGTLFVIFEGIKPDAFNNGAEFLVTFSDAFGNKFAAPAKLSAQQAARLSTIPGLHTEMQCKAPPALLDKLQPPVPVMPIPGAQPPPPKGG